MGYCRLVPRPALAGYIESIWIQEDLRADDPSRWPPTRVLPTGLVDLVINYSDPFVQHTKKGLVAVPRISLTGPWSGPVEFSATGRTGLIIVKFYPGRAYPFFRVPFSELSDLHVELDSLVPPRLRGSLENALSTCKEARQRVQAVESLLLKLLDETERDALVEHAVGRIERAAGAIRVKQLADGLHMSRRQLLRRFQMAVGMSPKALASVNRFQKALFLRRMCMEWSRIVDGCGYFDQSHFISEMRRFTGCSPEQIQVERSETSLMRYFNDSRGMSHFSKTTYL